MKPSIQTYLNKNIQKDNITYSLDEICPICGVYTPDGGICDNCLKDHNLYKPKLQYIDL